MPVAEAIPGIVVNGLTRLAAALGPKVTTWRSPGNVARDVGAPGALATLVADAAASLGDGLLPADRPLDDLVAATEGIIADVFEAYQLATNEQNDQLDELRTVFAMRFQRDFGDLGDDVVERASRAVFDRLSNLASELCGVSIATGALPADELTVPPPATAPDPDMEMGHFLFMDIVGYSQETNDRQHELIHTLNAIVRGTRAYTDAFEHGRLVALPTGDGIALAFLRTVQAAVRCAVEIAERIRDSHPDLMLRMGVHQGPVYHTLDINDAANVAGDGINIAQRVMDCGDAGHILLSHDVAAVLERLTEWAGQLTDLGEYEVKHGMRLRLYNLQRGDVGNTATPQRRAPAAAPTDHLADIPPPTLRLERDPEDGSVLTVTLIERTGDVETTTVAFPFSLSEQDERDIAWYVEDFLEHPYDPAPTLARGVEARMSQIGAELFDAVFHADPAARSIWASAQGRLHDARVEIVDRPGDPATPWELMREPDREEALSLRVREFVRVADTGAHTTAEARPLLKPDTPVRILLVICRPGREEDISFRSEALRIVRTAETSGNVELDVLRPATYERLAEKLQEAQANERPFHIVHFDGHGVHMDLEQTLGAWAALDDEQKAGVLRRILRTRRVERRDAQEITPFVYPDEVEGGDRGYLVFESPATENNMRLVDGRRLGALAHDMGVPILILRDYLNHGVVTSSHAKHGSR